MIETSLVRAKAVEAAIKGDLTLDYTCAVSSKDELSDLMERDINSATIQPYAIRDSWLWVELSEIVANVKYPFADGPFGSNLKREHYTTDHQVRIIQLSNIGELGWKDENEKYTTYEHLETIKRSEVEAGNIVIAKMMPAGRAVIVPDGSSKYVLSSDCVKYVPFEKLNARYICYAINSPMFRKQVLGGVHGIGRERTSLSKLKKYVIPLPTIEEQNLIVERLDRIFALLDRIDLLQERYSANYDTLKDKIIDAGIRGELTEQLPEDGTAEELYQQIQAEKNEILKERKGRADKKIKEVDDDVPFDIPHNWKWIRFGEIGLFKKGPFGSALTKSMFVPKSSDTIKVYEQQHAIRKDPYLGTYYITREYFDAKMNGFEAMPGDIIVSCAGTIGETYILPDGIEQGIINQALMRITLAPSIDERFFQFYFDSNLKSSAQSESNGTAITNIPPFDVLKNWYFPLPPIAEQKRIVERIEELLAAMP